nr:unnamed protein product [Digitaria exilis]
METGVSDQSCRITQQETNVGTKCMDGSESAEPETEPVTPVVPRHPKSYMEDIDDNPQNPDQPISKPRMAPKPKFPGKTAMGKAKSRKLGLGFEITIK